MILTAILIIYAIRFAAIQFSTTENPDASDLTEFALEVYGEPGGIEFEDPNPTLPMFEPEAGQWRLDGDRLYDFAPLVDGLEIDAHGSSPFVVASLPMSATVDDYRKAIASLAGQGICRVGIYSPSPAENLLPPNNANPNWPPKGFIPVYHVLSVKRDSNVSEPCRNRFPAWP